MNIWLDCVAGLHHNPVPETLLEGRATVLSQQHQPEHDLRWPAGKEDLGTRHIFCPFQAILHPWHHHGERHAPSASRWKSALQLEVTVSNHPRIHTDDLVLQQSSDILFRLCFLFFVFNIYPLKTVDTLNLIPFKAQETDCQPSEELCYVQLCCMP